MNSSCYVGTQDPADLIIMEDLAIREFRTADRCIGLDIDHVKLAVAKLAKMHAASAVLIANNGLALDSSYDQGIFNKKIQPFIRDVYKQNTPYVKESMATWKCQETVAELPEDFRGKMLEKMFEIIERDDSRFNVLLHGDLWCNNLMFRYNADDGAVEDCLLVDYQMVNYNSPMLDLQYLIYTSVAHDLKMNSVDEIIHYYHQQLVANLQKLGYEEKRIPKLLDLQKDFLNLGLYGVVTAFGTFAVMVAPGGDDSDLETIWTKEEAGVQLKRRMYSNPIYVKAMEELLPVFHRKGYFEE